MYTVGKPLVLWLQIVVLRTSEDSWLRKKNFCVNTGSGSLPLNWRQNGGRGLVPPRLMKLAHSFLSLVLAVVVSVDITPAALEYLLQQGWKDVWVSDVYYT